MPTIGVLAAGVFGAFACLLAPPLLAALIDGDWPALEAFALLAIGYGFLAAIAMLALGPRVRPLARAGVFAAAIVIWVCLVIAATPAFVLIEGLGLAEAVFEAGSAAVTLGTTVTPLAEISPAMTWYRGVVGWTGGLTTLTLAVYVLGPYGVGGMPNANLRHLHHARDEGHPRILPTLRAVSLPYLGLTALCAVLLMLTRVEPADAPVIAMSMLATNGFLPHQAGTSVLDNPAAEIVMIAFMVVGATSIVWHRLLVARVRASSRESDEARLYLRALVVLAGLAVLAAIVWPPEGRAPGQAALAYVFDTISIATTTGIAHDRIGGTSVPFEIVVLVAFVGGCSYSTAGGIKAFRLSTMLRHVGNELDRLVYPNAMLKDDVQHDAGQRSIAKAVWSAFFLSMLTVTIGTLSFAAQGHALPDALALAVGAFSQIASLVAGALPADPDGGTLLTIAGLATVARIEILVVLAALVGNRW